MLRLWQKVLWNQGVIGSCAIVARRDYRISDGVAPWLLLWPLWLSLSNADDVGAGNTDKITHLKAVRHHAEISFISRG